MTDPEQVETASAGDTPAAATPAAATPAAATPVSETTGGTGLGHREVNLTRTGHGTFRVRNERGGELDLGSGESADFTPVELLLAAMAGCSAVDVDFITGKRAEPTDFEVRSVGEKRKDDVLGNYLGGLEVTFSVHFPEGEAGDKARAMLPRAIQMSHDRLCTVSRTLQLPTDVTMREGE